jgi:hypothetical protein
MQDLLARLTSDDAVAIVFLALTFLAGMVVWLSLQWRLHRRTELEAALKLDMLSRGMSAHEIERVLRAPFGRGGDSVAGAPGVVPRAEFESGPHASHSP